MTSTESPWAPVRGLAFALGLLAFAGCGGPTAGLERFPVKGTITLDGKPLKSGTVMFIAQQQGASGSVDVADGAFLLAGADGLSPGSYRVEVYSIQPTGKKVPSSDDPATLIDETANLVPKQYNTQSTLKAVVPPGGPKEPLSFALASVVAKPTRR
ncbi:hypothetical protein ACYOEI_19410 [Singulisphaera rosea]